jgi:hypothetical protein
MHKKSMHTIIHGYAEFWSEQHAMETGHAIIDIHEDGDYGADFINK